MSDISPEERVGKTANTVIFLGILYSVLTLVAIIGAHDATQRWIHIAVLTITIGVIGLGYGIRYGSFTCLYATTGLFFCLTGYFLTLFVSYGTLRPAIRCILGTWALFVLYRSVPAMRILKQTHSAPLRTSRYGEFFLRRRGK